MLADRVLAAGASVCGGWPNKIWRFRGKVVQQARKPSGVSVARGMADAVEVKYISAGGIVKPADCDVVGLAAGARKGGEIADGWNVLRDLYEKQTSGGSRASWLRIAVRWRKGAVRWRKSAVRVECRADAVQ